MNTIRARKKCRTSATVSPENRCTGTSNRWECIADDNDIEAIRAVVISDDEHTRGMRDLSPSSILLSETERLQVLDALRNSWSERRRHDRVIAKTVRTECTNRRKIGRARSSTAGRCEQGEYQEDPQS